MLVGFGQVVCRSQVAGRVASVGSGCRCSKQGTEIGGVQSVHQCVQSPPSVVEGPGGTKLRKRCGVFHKERGLSDQQCCVLWSVV